MEGYPESLATTVSELLESELPVLGIGDMWICDGLYGF